MHIPDNYLSPSTVIIFAAAMIPVWKISAKKVKEELTEKKIPLLGVCAAFSFLIMMFNVPLPGGTTGHAVGATLAAILIGPYAAILAVTIALAVQALFFGDGGILAFGVNCFNLAFVMSFVGYQIYSFIRKRFKSERAESIAIFLAAYISLNFSALLTSLELGIQPILFKDSLGMPLYCPYDFSVSIPGILIPHLLVVGFIEGFVTLAVYKYIKKALPNIIYKRKNASNLYLLIIGMIILTPLGLLATGTAWGEWGMEDIKSLLGFIPKGMKNGFNFNSIMPDYALGNLNEIIAYLFSAIFGVVLIFGIVQIFRKKEKIKVRG